MRNHTRKTDLFGEKENTNCEWSQSKRNQLKYLVEKMIYTWKITKRLQNRGSLDDRCPKDTKEEEPNTSRGSILDDFFSLFCRGRVVFTPISCVYTRTRRVTVFVARLRTDYRVFDLRARGRGICGNGC